MLHFDLHSGCLNTVDTTLPQAVKIIIEKLFQQSNVSPCNISVFDVDLARAHDIVSLPAR